MQGTVEICGVNTAKLPVLKNEETQSLLRRSREGDKAAREELISGNLRLVLSVIQKFSGRGENVDDLFQVGCIGLIKAIDNFDPAQNVRFSTYGVPLPFPWGKRRKARRFAAAPQISPRAARPAGPQTGSEAPAPPVRRKIEAASAALRKADRLSGIGMPHLTALSSAPP